MICSSSLVNSGWGILRQLLRHSAYYYNSQTARASPSVSKRFRAGWHTIEGVLSDFDPGFDPGFDPLVREWFERRFGTPTEPQQRGWPVIRAGDDVLISAPTGSGKTLAA